MSILNLSRVVVRFVILGVAGVLLFSSLVWAGAEERRKLLRDSISVLEEIMETPEKGIPFEALAKAKGVIIFPTMVKGGFILGVRYGKGVASVRLPETGTWSPPAFLTTVGGSLGFQAGAEAIDLILLVMNQRGVESLLKDEFTLGGDVGIAAGPVGRHAEAGADLRMKGEIYSYSRSKGLFAGISLKGTSIHADNDANELYYRMELSPEDILILHKAPKLPESANRFIQSLNRLAPPPEKSK
ncbi:MAG: lipid-binding SYLF domain-containing protein [Nitrospinales bacterium]